MRKDLVRKGICDGCDHKDSDHADDGEYFVECKVEGCKCGEYTEDHYTGDDTA